MTSNLQYLGRQLNVNCTRKPPVEAALVVTYLQFPIQICSCATPARHRHCFRHGQLCGFNDSIDYCLSQLCQNLTYITVLVQERTKPFCVQTTSEKYLQYWSNSSASNPSLPNEDGASSSHCFTAFSLHELLKKPTIIRSVNFHRLLRCIIHRVSKNAPPLTCYNLDTLNPITIILAEVLLWKSEIVFPPHLSSVSALPYKIGNPEDSTLVHCACNTVQLLQCYRLPPEPCPQQPCGLNALITWFRESYSILSVSRESKTLKKSSSWLNSTNALIQHLSKNAIFVFLRFAR